MADASNSPSVPDDDARDRGGRAANKTNPHLNVEAVISLQELRSEKSSTPRNDELVATPKGARGSPRRHHPATKVRIVLPDKGKKGEDDDDEDDDDYDEEADSDTEFDLNARGSEPEKGTVSSLLKVRRQIIVAQ